MRRQLSIGLAISLTMAGNLCAQRADNHLSNANVIIEYSPRRPVNRFTPAHDLGGAVDGHDKGSTDLLLTETNIREMLSAGLKPLTYRLRTELAGDAWHWNSRGAWSDANRQQGYWTSNADLAEPISVSYGYRLPRRGNTIDQANDDGYSRLDDGDNASFWKSNPYLDRAFTGENNSIHPQWVVVEFAKPEPINAVRILWGAPCAQHYQIQYGNFDDVSDIALSPKELWHDFPLGKILPRAAVRLSKSEQTPLRISLTPIKARWLRILMTESSATGLEQSSDVRDRAGFAMREIYAGYQDPNGTFHDRIHHAADRKQQTIIHVSSTDPWHRESDRDEGIEQPGFDRVFTNGLTNDLPMLLPSGLLYDTPENAANEIRYLRARAYKFDSVELGEEPDGQYISPEDYGALYLQWAEAIHRVAPSLKLGGPSFQEILKDQDVPADRGNSEWLRRFLDYLKRRGRAKDFSFFSFEWYPFDDVCGATAPQLARAPRMLENSLRAMQRYGLSRDIPWIITEYGYSAFGARAELDLEGALLNADIVGEFLTLGGDQAFLFGYTPGYIDRDSPCTAGNNMLFSLGDDNQIKDRFATYFGARLLTQEWLQPGDGVHEIYPAKSDARDPRGNQLVTAYVVRRPDGLWSVLLINKDPNRAFQVRVGFRDLQSKASSNLAGVIDIFQYSGKQYALDGSLDNPHPKRAEPPEHTTMKTSGITPATISLPSYSLTIIRGRMSSRRIN
ncbi:MAG TPA: discoidin domain-containing protein [Pyrinomonadaceae bacterium]|nr:discoidin domain-containing protein [Pyrinomonadaceae bacterium]